MNVVPRKTDRRIERTRQLLRDALMALIVEKGYEAVSIQDITDKANVARTTFYLHFKDKDDLLFSEMREIYDNLAQQQRSSLLDELVNPKSQQPNADDFIHVQQYADFYRVMLSSKGSITILIWMLEYLTEVMGREILNDYKDKLPPEIPAGVVGAFLGGAQIGVVHWWLNHGQQHTPEEMAQVMHRLCLSGLASTLDLPPESPKDKQG